ncbi:MAG: hypothetical protein L6R36_005201 [Xanthoria steineri]|nr:MAG: hypothetical protein L6R36_005201 [Xanthoria steineri]
MRELKSHIRNRVRQNEVNRAKAVSCKTGVSALCHPGRISSAIKVHADTKQEPQVPGLLILHPVHFMKLTLLHRLLQLTNNDDDIAACRKAVGSLAFDQLHMIPPST